ncbi:MAG: glycosyltransferase family 9 protein, partial [Alphaproteobacteria bacterium]
ALAISYNLMAEMPHKSGGYSKAIEQLLQLNRTQEAMNLLEQMKENCKDDEDIGITYGVSKLQFGDLKQGFAAYERRFDREEMVSHAGRYIHYLPVPRLNHWREAVGKRVVVYLEQGIGDIVQFFRYLPLLRAHASKIILVYGMSSKPFRDLLGSLDCVDEHYDNLIDIAKDPLPHFDTHCALMSLPYIFETTIDTIPPAPPFITPKALIDQWGARLGAKTKPRIGLVVSGNAMQGNDFNRSANLSLLQPLIHENAETILVQRDLRAPDVELAKQLGLLHLGKEFNTLQDTAAAYHHFDLIIGIETGIMHLAATQGKPVWKMLTTLPDWRYFRDRSDSPFYPNVRLFRQEKYGDWHGLAQQVRPELDKFIASLT